MAGKSCNDLEEPETSSVTVKNGCSEVGVRGYDCDFVESPADNLLCKICQYPARDPVLTECCGQNFCSCCLERYLQSKLIIAAVLTVVRRNFKLCRTKRPNILYLILKCSVPTSIRDVHG